MSPIGRLIVEAETEAKKKPRSVATEEAVCGCRVQVSYFSAWSSNVHIERCHDHAYQRDGEGGVIQDPREWN